MDPATKRRFGRVELDVTVMGYGAAPIGNIFRPVAEEEAAAMIHAAWTPASATSTPRRSMATACSEHRLGEALRWLPRDGYVLSTKVGGACCRPARARSTRRGLFETPLPFDDAYDYSYDGVMRSVEDSLQRLGAGPHRHPADPRRRRRGPTARGAPARFGEVMDGGYRAMASCARRAWSGDRRRHQRGAGLPGRSPSAATSTASCWPAATRCWSRRALDELLPLCERARHRAIVLAAPYNSGILATGAVPAPSTTTPRHRPNHGPRGPDRGGVRPPRRAAGQRRAAVPAGPSQRSSPRSRAPAPGGDRPEPGHLRGPRFRRHSGAS